MANRRILVVHLRTKRRAELIAGTSTGANLRYADALRRWYNVQTKYKVVM